MGSASIMLDGQSVSTANMSVSCLKSSVNEGYCAKSTVTMAVLLVSLVHGHGSERDSRAYNFAHQFRWQ
jgi:hypothetical protein